MEGFRGQCTSDTSALCTIADLSSLVNISLIQVQCRWLTFSLQETPHFAKDSSLTSLMPDLYPSKASRHTEIVQEPLEV